MPNNKRLLLQYAGFAVQLMVLLGIAVYSGLWLDKKRTASTPLFIWLLPLLALLGALIKAIKDTSKK